MREWLSSVLVFIGSTSLTDNEWDDVNALKVTTNVYDQGSYDELSKVLTSRDSVSNYQEKLIALFKVKGFDAVPAKTGKSDILLGMVLE